MLVGLGPSLAGVVPVLVGFGQSLAGVGTSDAVLDIDLDDVAASCLSGRLWIVFGWCLAGFGLFLVGFGRFLVGFWPC